MKKLATLLAVIAGITLAGTGGIAGQITDIATGQPIANAIVVACSDSTVAGRAQTNERGLYLIEGLEPGLYRVIARARGYIPAHTSAPVAVREGEVTEGVDLRLRPIPPRRGAISGRVTDRLTGEPLRGAVVIVRGEGETRRSRTDRQGYYIIRGLKTGTYHAVAKARRYLIQEYPEPVVVRPGVVTEEINFALQPKPRGGGISGQVIDDKTGRPIPGALVIARGENINRHARTNGHGFYLITGLRAGDYEVSAMKPGYQPETYPGSVTVNPGEITRDINFRLERLENKLSE